MSNDLFHRLTAAMPASVVEFYQQVRLRWPHLWLTAHQFQEPGSAAMGMLQHFEQSANLKPEYRATKEELVEHFEKIAASAVVESGS